MYMEILQAFILLVVIMDPVLSLAAFLSLTKNKTPVECTAIAMRGTAVAAFVFFLFAFGGSCILQLLAVSMDGFKAAGGIILILLGIQLSMGIVFPKEKEEEDDGISSLAVVIGTPLISGPAAITTTILLVNEFGLFVTLVAGTSSLVIILLTLLGSRAITKIIGRGGLRVLSTMMGIVTLAWGVEFLMTGISGLGAT
ncbi:MAG: MarC family protein [Candidatus Bilamarchaeaceae archaeon]